MTRLQGPPLTPHAAMAAWATACSAYDAARTTTRAAVAAREAQPEAYAGPATPARDALRRNWLALVPAQNAAERAEISAYGEAYRAYYATHGRDVANLFMGLVATRRGPGQVEAIIAALLAPPTGPAQ